MFINPEDRRLGNRRQQLTRQQIAAQLDNEKRRRRGMSRFARTGQDRIARGRRAPLRGVGAGPRAADVGRAGGLAQFLGARIPGNPAARRHIEPPIAGPPRIGPPAPPPQLPGDVLGEREQPIGLDIVRDFMSQDREHPYYTEALDALRSPQRTTPLAPEIIEMLTGGGGPTTPVSNGVNLAGLIPLGGGTWFDPATGQLHGAGGLNNIAI